MKLKLKYFCTGAVFLCFTILFFYCLSERLPSFLSKDNALLLSTAFNVPATESYSENIVLSTESTENQSESESKSEVKKTYSEGFANSKNGYPIIEQQYQKDGIIYDNISLKNVTSYTPNIKNLLNSPLGFKIEDSRKVQVLIYHTHACESYLTYDTGYYKKDYYPRTTDDDYNVTSVGDEIERELKKGGIGVVHDKTHHDYPSYNGGYDRSYDTIKSYMSKYPNIKVVLDIHRDAIGYGGEKGKIKPTFTYKGKKAAQIMIMTGYDPYGNYGYKDWKSNLIFGLKIQKTAEDMFPGITRPFNFGDYCYNLNVCTGSLLIEVGTDVNTLDEAKLSGKLLGKALLEVLQN
ncbi:MAG: stage II sporulation protein P [Acutalibacteraceae bacterium]